MKAAQFTVETSNICLPSNLIGIQLLFKGFLKKFYFSKRKSYQFVPNYKPLSI